MKSTHEFQNNWYSAQGLFLPIRGFLFLTRFNAIILRTIVNDGFISIQRQSSTHFNESSIVKTVLYAPALRHFFS